MKFSSFQKKANVPISFILSSGIKPNYALTVKGNFHQLEQKVECSYADFERVKQVKPDQSESLLNLFSKLRKDEVADVIKKDPLILEFASCSKVLDQSNSRC